MIYFIEFVLEVIAQLINDAIICLCLTGIGRRLHLHTMNNNDIHNYH